jgi:hypothetical protein
MVGKPDVILAGVEFFPDATGSVNSTGARFG